jgi:hypothetical protein
MGRPSSRRLRRGEPWPRYAPPTGMVRTLKWTALALVAALGIWLTFQQGIEARFVSAWSCAASRALICVQR